MRFCFSVLLAWLLFGNAVNAQIPPRPSPPRLVNDLAQVIPDLEENALERKLVAYSDSTSTQITVVTVESLGGDAPYNFAQEILEQWGVGQKGKDNGIVILVAPNERQTFISTGYGVESNLTDARSKRIIETVMVPNFKQGNYYIGLDLATTAIIAILSGQFTPDSDNGGGEADAFIALFLFFLLILIILITIYSSKNRGNGMGRTYSGRGVNNSGPVVIHWGDNDFGSFSGGFGSFGGFGGGSGGGGGAGGSW